MHGSVERQPQSPYHDDYYLGAAVSLLLNYIQKGEAHRGWKRFLALIDLSQFKDPEWAKEAQAVAAELKAIYQF